MASLALSNATIAASAPSGSVIGAFNVSGLVVLKTDPKVNYFSISGANLIGKWSSPPTVGVYKLWVYVANREPRAFYITITPAEVKPTPASVTLTPVSVSVPDNSASGILLSNIAVKMSDTSTFAGTLTLPANALVSVTGASMVLNRALVAGDDGAHQYTVTATQNGGSASATLALTVTAVAPTISLDGTMSAAPNGSALTTADGKWTWGSAVAGRPGEYNVNLNGSAAPGIGTMMEVANSGKLYANTVNNGWYLWNNGFSKSPGPTGSAPPPPPPPPTLVLSLSPPPQIPDNSPSGTLVSTATAQYSDGTQPAAVTLTSSDTTFIKIQGMQLVLARAMTTADDGTHTVTITASDGLGALATARLFG